jgi:transposase
MDTKRDALRKQDQETLIDTIEVLAERVTSWEKQVRELKKLLALPSSPAVRPAKTPANSSKPSSQSEKANLVRRGKQKRGAKPGHRGISRQNSVPDEVIDCRASMCSQCGQALANLSQHQIGSRQILEVPARRYIVREARCYGVTCPRCGCAQRGRYPDGFEASRTWGPRLEQIALYWHAAHPLSYQRLQQVFQDL